MLTERGQTFFAKVSHKKIHKGICLVFFVNKTSRKCHRSAPTLVVTSTLKDVSLVEHKQGYIFAALAELARTPPLVVIIRMAW